MCWESDFRPFQGSRYLNCGSNVWSLDKGGFTSFSLVYGLDRHICSHALIIHSIYKGKLSGSMKHKSSMGLYVEGEDLRDVRVVKCYSEIGEAVKVDWSAAQTGFHGT